MSRKKMLEQPWTLLAEDSLAKMSVSRELARGYQERAQYYGKNTLASLAKLSHDGLWLKMYEDCFQMTLDNSLEKFLETWPDWGMMRNGVCHQLLCMDSPIKETEYSYLPTPQASDGTFLMIRRPLYLIGTAYRIKSNQDIDGNAKMADIAWNVWGGPLNPQYVEAMMGFPQNWTKIESMPSETP